MKAHIARNQNAGIPLALGWNLSAADRGILENRAIFAELLQFIAVQVGNVCIRHSVCKGEVCFIFVNGCCSNGGIPMPH